MVRALLEGYNCSLFAYGQTGAGKTHTMMGVLGQESLRGLQPRCLEYLFYLLKEKQMETLIKVTYVEIYNEKIYDLLTEDDTALSLREDLKQGVYIESVTEEIVASASEAMNVLKVGQNRRRVSETQMN